MSSKVIERGYQRATLRVPVEFGVERFTGKGASLTISIGGMFIETTFLLPEHTELWLRFSIPGYGEIKAKGIIIWKVTKPLSRRFLKPGFAVKFIEISEEDIKKIEGYVLKKSRVMREIKFLLSKDKPDMKRINELLTSTYIKDYSSIEHLRKRVEDELALFRLRARV